MTTIDLRNKQLTHVDAKLLANVTDLTDLNLQDNFIESHEAAFLVSNIRRNESNLSSLTSLNLSTNPFATGTAAVAQLVHECPNLKSLALFEARIGDRGARVLAGAITEHPSLEYLNLNANGISLPAAMDLMLAAQTCKSLKDLHLWGNSCCKHTMTKIHEDLNLQFTLHM